MAGAPVGTGRQAGSALLAVRVGTHARSRSDFLSDSLRTPWVASQERDINAVAAELLADLGLEEVAHRRVTDLPTGTQKRVELARALAGHPKLMLLDEPASG